MLTHKSLPITRCWASLSLISLSAADKMRRGDVTTEGTLRATLEGGNLISRSITAVGMSQIDTAE